MNKPTQKVNLYRVTYRIRNNGIKEPFVSELIVKSTKEEKEIDFADAVKKYWKKNDANLFYFDSVSFVEKIGEE